MRKRSKLAVALVLVLGAAGYGLALHWRTRNVGPVQRGFRVAEVKGCFGCHGPGGLLGHPDPGGGVGGVPAFSQADVQSYARDDGEVREWILDGMSKRMREELGSRPAAERPLLNMPAWRDLLSRRELDDLVAYVKAVSDFETPAEEKAEAGREAAARLGCFTCHGPQGRGNPPNPRSLKGYIPSWDGADLPELARDDGEVREWILDGSPRRLRENPLAALFLKRQALQMPAYRGRISNEQVGHIVDYIRWLRKVQR